MKVNLNDTATLHAQTHEREESTGTYIRNEGFRSLQHAWLDKCFSLHMHAKASFAHRLQTAKISSSRSSAQNNDPGVENNGPWV